MYIVVNAEGRIKASSMDTIMTGAVEIEAPEGFTSETQMDYRLENGALVREPLPAEVPQLTETEKLKVRADAVEAAMDWAISMILGGM